MIQTRLYSLFVQSQYVFLGLIFFTAGMSKLYAGHQFPGLMGPVWLSEVLEKYQLKLFGDFIASAQILIGFSMLSPRFRPIGCIMLFPMLLNILLITISQQWRGTPWVVGVFLLQNLLLLLHERKLFLHLLTGKVHIQTSELSPKTIKGHLLWISGLLLCGFSIGLSYHQMYLAWLCALIGLLMGFVAGWADKTKHLVLNQEQKPPLAENDPNA